MRFICIEQTRRLGPIALCAVPNFACAGASRFQDVGPKVDFVSHLQLLTFPADISVCDAYQKSRIYRLISFHIRGASCQTDI